MRTDAIRDDAARPAEQTVELGPQVFLGDEPDPEKFVEPENHPHPRNKPDGGLWTSPLRDDGTCDWVDWCRAEGYGIDDPGDEDLWRLEPESELTVAVVDSLADLEAYLDVYERIDVRPTIASDAALDFEELASVYDAVYLTEDGQRDTHLSEPSLYGWDCECVLWLDWRFADWTYHGTIADHYDAEP